MGGVGVVNEKDDVCVNGEERRGGGANTHEYTHEYSVGSKEGQEKKS